MDLDVLARRHVRDAAPVRVRDVVQAVHLFDRQRAAGDLDALHVAGVVELIVEPITEPHRAEFVGRDGTRDVLLDAVVMTREPVAHFAITWT